MTSSFTVKADLRCPHTSHIVKAITSRAFPKYTGRTVYLQFTTELPASFTSPVHLAVRTESKVFGLAYNSAAESRANESVVVQIVGAISPYQVVVSHSMGGQHGEIGRITISIQAPFDHDAFQVVVDARLADPLENATPRRFGTWTSTLAALTPGESWGNYASPGVVAASPPHRVTRRDLVMAAVEGRVTELARKQTGLERDFAKKEAEDHARVMDYGSELGLPAIRSLDAVVAGRYRRVTGPPAGMTRLQRFGLVRETKHDDLGLGSTFSYVVTKAGRIVINRVRYLDDWDGIR